MEEMLELDVWYTNNLSFYLDIYILINTFWKVVFQRGINKSKDATMPKLFRDINGTNF